MAYVKRVELTGSEICVSGLGGQNVAVKNLGTGTIYASIFPDITADADNVSEIPAGGGEVVLDARGTVYLFGTGKVQCTGTDYATPNFKLPSSSGNGGGGGKEGDKGVYCGITEFVSSDLGIKSTTIEYSADFPAKLAEILAEETGWELQDDGVTVLKDGGVGFKFTATHVWLARDTGSPAGFDFQYINGPVYNGVTIDLCRGTNGIVAFGCRGINDDGTEKEMGLAFVLSQTSNGDDVAVATYTDRLYLLQENKYCYQNINGIKTEFPTNSIALCPIPDLHTGVLLNAFLLLNKLYRLNGDRTAPGKSVFSIGDKRFRLLKSTVYSSAPLLAIPI